MQKKESPIFSRTYDFVLWLSQHTGRFPKNERFRLAKRIEDAAFDFYDGLIEAVHSPEPRPVLRKASLDLDRLRLYLRLSFGRQLTSASQFEFCSMQVVSLGNLLGGWMKSLPESMK